MPPSLVNKWPLSTLCRNLQQLTVIFSKVYDGIYVQGLELR